MGWGEALALLLKLVLLYAGSRMGEVAELQKKADEAYKEGLDAIKNRDAGAYGSAIQRLRRLREETD